MTMYDLDLKIKGYSEKEKANRELMRRVAMFSYYGGAGLMGGKKNDFNKMWPSEYESGGEQPKGFEAKRESFKDLISKVNESSKNQNKQ